METKVHTVLPGLQQWLGLPAGNAQLQLRAACANTSVAGKLGAGSTHARQIPCRSSRLSDNGAKAAGRTAQQGPNL